MPDRPRAVELAVVLPGRIDLDAHGRIRFGPVGVTDDRPPVIIGGRDKLQRPADRLATVCL